MSRASRSPGATVFRTLRGSTLDAVHVALTDLGIYATDLTTGKYTDAVRAARTG